MGVDEKDYNYIIDKVDEESRRSELEFKVIPGKVTKTLFRLKSSLYNNEMPFDSVSSFFEFLKNNPDILKRDFYITVCEEVDLSLFSDFDFPIRVMNQELLMKEDTYDYKNVVIESSIVRFDGYLKSMNRCAHGASKFYIYELDDETIGNLQVLSNSGVELDLTINCVDHLMHINKLISQVSYKGKVNIKLSNNFFDDLDNRKILHDEEMRKFLRNIDYNRVELSFRNMQFKNFDDLFKTYEIASFVGSKVPSDASDLEKIVFVTDFIIHYMKYDKLRQWFETTLQMKNKGEEKNLLSILNSGVGVCRHFSRALSFILAEVGIESEVLDQHAGLEGHSFNRVKCDGEVSYLDSTWLWRDLNSTNWIKSPYFMSPKTDFDHDSYLSDNEEKDPTGVSVDETLKEEAFNKVSEWKKSFKLKRCDIEDLINKRTYRKINKSLERGI